MTNFDLGFEEVAVTRHLIEDDPHTLRMLVSEKNEEIEHLKRMLTLTLENSPEAMKVLIRMNNSSTTRAEKLQKENERLFQLQKENEKLKQELEIDKLTGAKSQRSFIEFQTSPEPNCYAIVADLDGFKQVNDTFGHKTGDQILKKFVEILKKNVRTNDYVFRNGGDEFVVVFRNVSNENSVNSIYSKLAETLRRGVSISTENGVAHVSASISETRHIQDKNDFHLLDMEMYRDKERRKVI